MSDSPGLGPCDRDGCDSVDFVRGWMIDTGKRDAYFGVPVGKFFCSRECAETTWETLDREHADD